MKISFRSEKHFSIFICFTLIYFFIVTVAKGMSQLTEASITVISIGLKIVIGAYFLLLIPGLIRHRSKSMAVIIFGTLVVASVNYYMFPLLREYFLETVKLFFTGILPVALVSMAIDDSHYLKKCLLVTSRVIAVASLFLLCCVFFHKVNFYDDSYSMRLGYTILIPILLLFYQLVTEKKKNRFDVVGLVILILVLVSFGSRGPILSIPLFVIFYTAKIYSRKRRYFQACLVVLGAFLLFLVSGSVLRLLGDILSDAGIHSRTIYMFTNNDVLSDEQRLSNRNYLWETLIPEIEKHPFAVRGINAEWRVIGGYAHSIVIELLYQFGIVIGSVILVWIGFVACRQMFSKSYSLGNDLCIILMFSSLPGLIFSGSVWSSCSFWLWLGVSFGGWRMNLPFNEGKVADEIFIH